MSRFSIRTQVFALAGAFLALTICSALFSLFGNSRVSSIVMDATHTSEFDVAISEVQTEAERALLSVLMVDRGEPTAFDSLETHLAQSIRKIDSVSGEVSEFSDRIGLPDTLGPTLAGVREKLAGLHAEMPKIREALGHERSRDFRNRVIPLLQDVSDRLEVEHMSLKAQAASANDQMVDVVDNSSLVMLAGLVGAILVGLVLSFVFGRMLVNPVQRIVASVERIANKDYSAIGKDGERKDEIGRIARRLDSLREKLATGDAAADRAREESDRRVQLFEALGVSLSKLKSGDLHIRMVGEDWQDLGHTYVNLCSDFNSLAATLEELVESLRDSATTVESNSQELSNMSSEMSRRAEVQAATLEESAAALDELSESVQCAASRAQEADQRVTEGRRRAEEGGQVMTRAMAAMSSIAKSSEQITQIIGVIDDIAFQTNLLALNAGVEAARAGESGKGFAVVASEVRGLAQRAAESASEIKDLVLNSTQQVEDGEKLVAQTGVTLGKIVESVTSVSEMVSAIAISAREQASAVKEINVGVGELDKVTQENAAMVGDATTSSQQLSREATRLTDLLERFAGRDDRTDNASYEDGHAGSQLDDDDDNDGPFEDDGQYDTEHDARHGNWHDDDLSGDDGSDDDLDHDGWATDTPDPEPVRMEPHQSVAAANGDMWKDF